FITVWMNWQICQLNQSEAKSALVFMLIKNSRCDPARVAEPLRSLPTDVGQNIPSSSRAASDIFSGDQGGFMTSLTFALVTPSTPSIALAALCSIAGPAGQAGEVSVISTSTSPSLLWIE